MLFHRLDGQAHGPRRLGVAEPFQLVQAEGAARLGGQVRDRGDQLAQALGGGGRLVGGRRIGDLDAADFGAGDLTPGGVAGGRTGLATGPVEHQVEGHAVEQGDGIAHRLGPVAPRQAQIKLLRQILGRDLRTRPRRQEAQQVGAALQVEG